VHSLRRMGKAWTYGLPSGPNTMPFDSFLGADVSVSRFSGTSICPGAIFPAVKRFVVVSSCRWCRHDFKARERCSSVLRHLGT
jgi:hypothetical protein